MSESSRKHKSEAPLRLTFAIFTVSTSRYQKLKKGESVKDESGDLIESVLKSAGHTIGFRKVISDDRRMIQESIRNSLAAPNLDAVILCGGTGITKSDVTIETVLPFLEKTLPGFGETFRSLSFDEIGSAAILTRTIAGVAKGKAFFCLPGSRDAAKLCVERLISTEAGHIVKHARE
ncbi:MAG TPA: molybdenum cofactor biosynthesis protein B [Candidatus Acidoferrum sp.]|nr:molybdenum cofactor biosynthesis protein B [Candidatus Acidoferrum sp.]